MCRCAEYVKHMMATMKEKEEVVSKLKTELEVKQSKIEEDKAIQESRSDPESVASSLTSSTTDSRAKSNENKKRNLPGSEDSSGENNNNNKKLRMSGSRNESSISTGGDSSDRGSGGPNAQSFSIDKTVSSVSDITDSNRGSSSNNSGSGSGASQPVSHVSADEGDGRQPSTSSISSDAAVASEKSSRDRHSGNRHNHKDVVFNNDKRPDRKRPPEEVTSLERNFELDYEEVFNNSNIPQLIAATSGRIVTWNDCFLKATGLRKSEVKRMTIFSLVQPDKLSNFFEIVATALKPETESDTQMLDGSPPAEEEIQEPRHQQQQQLQDSSERPAPQESHAAAVSSAESSSEPSSQNEQTDTSESSSSEKEETAAASGDTSSSGGGDGGSSSGSDDGADAAKKPAPRTVNYAAMTLPCVNFPAMKKRRANEPSRHADPLHVTVRFFVTFFDFFAVKLLIYVSNIPDIFLL